MIDTVNMCPDCCEYPEYSNIENTKDYQLVCSCGWTAFGHTLADAARCWNNIMVKEHPIIENFEPISLDELIESKGESE